MWTRWMVIPGLPSTVFSLRDFVLLPFRPFVLVSSFEGIGHPAEMDGLES